MPAPPRAGLLTMGILALAGALAPAGLAHAQTALEFDGTSRYVDFGAGDATNLGVATFTLETWFKRTGAGQTTSTGAGGVTAVPLLAKGRDEGEGDATDLNYFLGLDGLGRLVADFEEGDGQTSPGLNHPVVGTTQIQANLWYHASATFDGTTFKLYLNGVLEAQVAVGSGRLPRNDSGQYGSLASALNSSGAAAGYFAGVLDEVRVWDHARPAQGIADSLALEIASAPGLRARWGLNDGGGTNVANSVAGSPDGTIVSPGGSDWVAGSPFALAFGLDFAGFDGYAHFGSPAALQLAQLTIELWVRRDGTGVSVNTGSGGIPNIVPLVSKGRADGEDPLRDINYLLGIRSTDGVLCADFEEGASGAAPSANHPVFGATSVGTGVWHHVAATYDGTWKLYLDGDLDGEAVVNRPMASASQLAVALASTLNQAGTPGGFFDGAVDEVRIWNVARSRSEIRASANARITSPVAGLVARWGLDEGAGATLRGSAGTAIDGALAGVFWGWVSGAPFDAELAPLDPALVAPADDATDQALDPELRVAVTDPNGDFVDVTFHGRAAGAPSYAVIGTANGVASGGEAAITWSGRDPLTEYEWYAVVADADGSATGPVWSFTTYPGTHVIQASAGPNGSIDPSGDVVVAHAGDQTFTITPATGYHVADVVVDAASVGAVTSYPFVNVIADHTIAASFAVNTYALGTSVAGNGSVARDPDQALYDHGTPVTLTATPAPNHHFVGWSGDATGAANPVVVTMDAAKSVTATFAIDSYALSVTVAGNGSVARDPDQALYDHGTPVTLTATPAANHHFVGWSGDATGAANPLVVTMDAAKSVTATFAIDVRTLGTSVTGNGSISREPEGPYGHGSTVTLTAVPATNHHFVAWSGDASGSANPIVLTMDADKSVTATFAIDQYALSTSVTGSGSVGRSPNQALYDHGASVTLSATPAAGFYFAGWSGDATGGTTPVVVAMTAPRSVTAHFVALPTQSLDVRIGFAADDAEEEGDDDVNLTSSDLEMMLDGETQNAVGLRFRNITVPRNATITNATIQFTVREATSGVTPLAIGVQASDNAPAFVATSGSLTSRPLTPGTTAWSPPNWTTVGAAGAAQRTPDFKAQLQPVVNRAGWNPGNAVVVLISGTGLRVAESHDHEPSQAALLHIDYQAAALQNQSPVVSAGPDRGVTQLVSASLDGASSDDGLPSGTLTRTWSVASGPGSVSFTAPNADDTQASFGAVGVYRLVLSANDGAIVSSDTVQVVVSPGYPTQTLDLRVAAGEDDAEEASGGSVDLASPDLEMMLDVTAQPAVGLRFRNVAIPQGATITTATLLFTADEPGAAATSLQIRAQAADDAGPFAASANDLTGRALGAASVAWNAPAWSVVGEAGSPQRSPELKALLQEVVDRAGWQSGNALALIVTGNGKRVAEAYDLNPNGAALLHVEYGGHLASVGDRGAGTALAAWVRPQPLRGRGALHFSLAAPGPARVDLFDVQGRRVQTLLESPALPAGEHRVEIGGRRALEPGLYFYRVSAGPSVAHGRVVVVR